MAPKQVLAGKRYVGPGSVLSTLALDAALARPDLPPSEVVVDVGCGASPHRDLVQAGRYFGVDLTFGSAAVVAPAEHLPFRSSFADGLLITEVLEHVADDRAAVREMARVVKIGGWVLVSLPFIHQIHEWPNDFRRLTPRGLAALLTDGGFTVEGMWAAGDSRTVLMDMRARLLLGRVRSVGRFLPPLESLLQRLLVAVQARASINVVPVNMDSPPLLALGWVAFARRVDQP